MTKEQQIRGKDGAVDWVLLVTGYSAQRVMALAETELHPGELERQGAAHGPLSATYRLDYSLTDTELT
jgi:hypothetical protein